jgi:hypothetical protein
MYHPYQFYYPKETYTKGEKPCIQCCIAEDGIIYRAPFSCKKIKTPTHLARFCIARGDPPMFRSHPADIPSKVEKQFSELFGWLNDDKAETKRSTKEKAPAKSKSRKDHNGSGGRPLTKIFYDDPKRDEVGTAPEKVEQPQGEPEGIRCNADDPESRGLPGVSEDIEHTSVQQVVRSVFGEDSGGTLSPVRDESDASLDREPTVGTLPNVPRKDKMTEEYDPSYEQTTAHACITCKCGVKVWYGCGVKQLTRPKYCTVCERKERNKIIASYKDKVDSHELHRILEWELRRGINR